jgi:toxin ParE1/3/4
MNFSLRILPAADADIDEAALYIAQDSEEHAMRLYAAVDATFRLIREHPQRWPIIELDHPRLRNVRRCTVSGFRNYSAFYTVDADVVFVIRVLHGARDIPSVLRDDFAGGPE